MIQMVVPEIVDMNMPAEGVFHNLVIVSIRKRFPGHPHKVMYALWGLGQMMFARNIVILDDDANVRDLSEVAWRVTGNVDAELTFDFSLAGLGTPSGDYTLLYRTGTSGTYTDLLLLGNVSGSTVSFDLLGLDTLSDGFYTIAETAVPEPSSVGLLGFGMALIVGRRRQARK